MVKNKGRLRSNDRDIKYDIAAAFEYILDSTNPRLYRAVKFYELQTALPIGKKLHACQERNKEHPDNWILVSRSAISIARIICRVRILEHIIADKYSDVFGKSLLKKLVRDKEATQLLRHVIAPTAPQQLACSLSWGELHRLLKKTRNEQKRFVPLYDISLHFALHGGFDWKCNWTRAEGILKYIRTEPEYEVIRKHYKYLKSSSTAYKAKTKGGTYNNNGDHFGVFMWMDHFGGGFLRPPRPFAGSFVKKLMAKIDDTSELRNYLGQYAYIQGVLKQQGYNLAELRLTASVPLQVVPFKPLPDDLAILV